MRILYSTPISAPHVYILLRLQLNSILPLLAFCQLESHNDSNTYVFCSTANVFS